VRSVSMSDVRSVFRLVTDLQELTRVDSRWRQTMAARISELIGADAALACASANPLSYPPRPKADSELVGWSCSDKERWMRLDLCSRDYVEPCIPLGGAAPGPQVTASRRQLLCDSTWYGAPYVNEVLHRFRVDDNLVSLYCVRPNGAWEALAFFRGFGSRSFGEAEVEVVRLFHEEMGRLWDRQARATAGMPPRLRQTLRGLLAGGSEKEIAAEMGISTHTVHDYVKALHVRFGVRSRGELLAAASAGGLRDPQLKNSSYRY